MRIHRDQRGQTLLLVALSLPLLLGFIGIATDVGVLFKDKRTLQTAADAAAIGGALTLNYGTSVTSAKAAATANGFTDGSDGVTVKIKNPPTWSGSNYRSSTGTANGYIEATITKSESTIFLAIFGYPSVTVVARAVATLGPNSTCVYTLRSSGNDINVNNGASLDFSNCSILDDSNDSDALTVTQGGRLTANSIGIVSGDWTSSEVNNGGQLTPPNPAIGIVPVSDPLSYLTAPNETITGCSPAVNLNTSQTFTAGASCYNGITIGGGATVTINNPGTVVINGNLNIANGAHVTLGSGLYYITGAFLGQGGTTITGTGVTFYMTGTNNSGGTPQINLANGVNLNLTAPNSPGSVYNGMLFWQASNDAQPIIIAGGANSTLQGVIYAPDAQLNISNGTSTHIYADLIVNSLTTVGGSTVQSYESLSGVSPVLTAAQLVE